MGSKLRDLRRVFGFLSGWLECFDYESATHIHIIACGAAGCAAEAGLGGAEERKDTQGARPHVWLARPEYYTRSSSLQIWLFLESACPVVAAKKTGSKDPGEWESSGDGRWEVGKEPRASESNEAWNFSTLATVSHFFILLFHQLLLSSFLSFFFFLAKYVSCDFGNLQWVFHIRMYIHTFSEKTI